MEYKIKITKKKRSIFNDSWVWKMAWNDGKKNMRRLMLFVSSIVIGIAGLVAINSLNQNLQQEIDNQAQELLGADIAISANTPFEADVMQALDSLPSKKAMQADLTSMLNILRTEQSRFVRVVANSPGFPFYGQVKTLPENQFDRIHEGKIVLVDENLATQYEISSGDTLKIGELVYEVAGIVQQFPGSNSFTSTFAPSVYIGMHTLTETGLVQFGSRVNYKQFIQLTSADSVAIAEESLLPLAKKYGHRFETAQSRKENLGKSIGNLYKFFNLLTFIALILGCIGVASSVHIYVQEKKTVVAVLRCIGTSGWQAFNIFFLQVGIFGLIGSVLGTVLGVGIQFFLPFLFGSYLPVEVAVSVVWPVVFEGILIGLVISVLFSVLPLLSVRFVPPLTVLRPSGSSVKQRFSKSKWATIALIILFPLLFAAYQTGSFLVALLFFAGLSVAFLLLWGVAELIMFLVKKVLRNRWSFIWKQGLSNLYRPNNQTTVMVVVIGLGAFLIATLTLIQNSLLQQVEFVGNANQSNTIVYDIQPNQVEGVLKIAEDNKLKVIQNVPIVTMRVSAVKGKTVREIQTDTSDAIPNWALTREYRVTYRDSLTKSEELLEGRVAPKVENPTDTIFVTVSEGFKENLELELGDSITFNVQGIPITTVIGGVRSVEWAEDPPNFGFVFPAGVLENAPQFNVLTLNIPEGPISAKFQRELIASFPTVSLIDLALVLKTLNDFFDKIAFIIQFLAFFSLSTGLVVLGGAVVNSKYTRLKENVMLRTIGARTKHIIGITLAEYTLLGVFASITGILLSIISGWALSVFMFDINFYLDYVNLLAIGVGVVLITLFIGWVNSKSLVKKSPLEVLRKEQ